MTGKVFILLFVLCTLGFSQNILVQPDPTKITVDALVSSTWKFYNDAGFLGTMKLERDGTISGYQNPNEVFWTFDGSFLHFITKNN